MGAEILRSAATLAQKTGSPTYEKNRLPSTPSRQRTLSWPTKATADTVALCNRSKPRVTAEIVPHLQCAKAGMPHLRSLHICCRSGEGAWSKALVRNARLPLLCSHWHTDLASSSHSLHQGTFGRAFFNALSKMCCGPGTDNANGYKKEPLLPPASSPAKYESMTSGKSWMPNSVPMSDMHCRTSKFAVRSCREQGPYSNHD